ncbi:Zinc finger, CCHC-type [Cinara cedri]|uniref:Zinc finger, CCHC-type n=1 Tax=Cinara cedri TaxID=506608 RepID=A0A5E4MI33_9HEMI|nr:Zinc finger, CCHC-type [Cinara cedri]
MGHDESETSGSSGGTSGARYDITKCHRQADAIKNDEYTDPAAIPGSEDDQAAIFERQAVQITGLWPTRSGQQIVTARMTTAAASIVIRVPIGWTMCRVHPRRPEPKKCFRCHRFGHRSSDCTGPNLSPNCKRCGELGHGLEQCLADKDL